jgi:hypothetical protein
MTIKTDMNLTTTTLGIGCSDYLTIDKMTATAFIETKEDRECLADTPWPFELQELREEILSKFNYMVDVFLLTPVQIAVRPKRSNLNTALIIWHEDESRYEVLSLRIFRDRRLSSSVVTRDNEYRVVAVKDAKRAASFVAGLAPYSDKEMAEYVCHGLVSEVTDIIGKDNKQLDEAFRNFRWGMDREAPAKEILRILDSLKQNTPIHLEEDSELLTSYAKFDTERKAIEEKKEHTGELAPMFMLRSSVNKNIILVTRELGIDRTTRSEVYAKSYDSFDDLPREVQRVVMTLEVKERNNIGVAEGVGVIPENWFALGGECCGFVVEKEFQQKFMEEVMAL